MGLLQDFGIAGGFRIDKGFPFVAALIGRQDAGRGYRIEEDLRGGCLLDRLLEDGLGVVGDAGRPIDAAPGAKGQIVALLGRGLDAGEARMLVFIENGEDLERAIGEGGGGLTGAATAGAPPSKGTGVILAPVICARTKAVAAKADAAPELETESSWVWAASMNSASVL
jgi:hypothetical protein